MIKGNQLVVFRIGKEHFGVGVETVREIVRVPEVTEVPDATDFLEGVINLRGRIVPVIDLRKRLRLEGSERTSATRVLITEVSDNTVGLIVDSVSEVLKIQDDVVEEPPELISAIGIEYITGVAKIEERLIILLDLAKILDVKDMMRLRNIADAPVEAGV